MKGTGSTKDRSAGARRHPVKDGNKRQAAAPSAARSRSRVIDGQDTANSTPVIAAAKISLPSLPLGHLLLPRLTSQIDAAPPGKIILINAPAGYGKTRLLTEWAAQCRDCTAWVALDDDDNDDHRFWAGVIAALSACPAVPAASLLKSIGELEFSSRNASFLAIVADALAALKAPVNLVLDNVHELVSRDALHGLAALVRDWPAKLRLVLATRAEPPLHFSRLRLAGRLFELRRSALALTPDEARSLLDLSALPFDAEHAELLLKQADGWPACLELSAQSIALAQCSCAAGLDNDVDCDVIGDYFETEVMSGLPDEVRLLLDACSICDHLPAGLAVALSGRNDAGKLLLWIARQLQLVVAETAQGLSFRLHPMLRSHFRTEIERERPECLAVLHIRASRWFDGAGDPEAAVRHATYARKDDWTAELLVRAAPPLIAAGQDKLVKDALDGLPHDLVASDPWLTLSAAMVCLGTGDLPGADVHISRASQASDQSKDWIWFRAIVQARRAWLGDDDMNDALKDVERYAPDRTSLPSRTGLASAIAQIHDSLAVVRARLPEITRNAEVPTSREARRNGQDRYRIGHDLTSLAFRAGLTGNMRQMAMLIEQIDNLVTNEDFRPADEQALVAVMRAYGMLMLAQPGECLRLVSLASKLEAAIAVPIMRSAMAVAEAAARFDIGQRSEGFEALQAARRTMGRHSPMVEHVATTVMFEYRAATLLGRTDSAREVLEWAEDRLGAVGEVLLMRALSSLKGNRYIAARNHLRPLLDGTVPPILNWTSAEGWLLQCEIGLHTGNQNGAIQALESALAIFAQAGVVRPMMTAPQQVIDLLIQHLGSLGPLEAFAREVLAKNVKDSQEILGVLTEREWTILSILPSQRTLEEIGRDLNVSVNTVKSHVKAIYAKLNVNSRRAAVAAAYRTGLFAS